MMVSGPCQAPAAGADAAQTSLSPACAALMPSSRMQDHHVREELLTHIAREAAAVREAGWRALKVVSDIDDTFLCSGGHFPSGEALLLPIQG